MGSWTTNYSNEVSVRASEECQLVEIPFPNFWGEIEDRAFEPIEEDAHINLCCGWVKGTTVVKKVEVFEIINWKSRGDETAINAVKATKADDAIYNLNGQRVNASYKGLVIKNGKKVIIK